MHEYPLKDYLNSINLKQGDLSKADQKMGRNEKITVQGPDGKKIEIKYKKLQNYLNKGFIQV